MIVPDLIKAVEAGQEKARLEIQGKHRMNERIKLLAEQASHQSPDGYPVTIPYSKDFVQKFAELIVRECGNVAWQHTPETEELEYSHLIKDKILERFGVKE
jgi:hypothetical protein